MEAPKRVRERPRVDHGRPLSYDGAVATEISVAVLTLILAEPVMAVVHRFVFHGPLWCSHESHHEHPTARRIVANDLLWLWPLLGSTALVTFGGPALAGAGIGIAAYIGAYIFMHDGVAHGRFWVPAFIRRTRVCRLLAETHHLHHRGGRHGGASPFAVYAAALEHGWHVTQDFVPAPKPCVPAHMVRARFAAACFVLATALTATAMAGPGRRCRQLCEDNAGICKATAAACKTAAAATYDAARADCADLDASGACRRAARADRRTARQACRSKAQACRVAPLDDCRRAAKEPVVEQNVDLSSCPTTPAPACSGLGPDEECTDPLHPADRFFWDTLHAGDYGAIPEVLRQLAAGLAERPADPSLTRHVAWANIWRLAENARGTIKLGELLQSLQVARPTFALARELEPGDPRILGFLASITFQEGFILGDDTLRAEGLALLEDAIDAWPEFNYFTAGYMLSQLPADSEEFRRGLEYQWKNIDVCSGKIVDRGDPEFASIRERETHVGRQRVCWNSWIAPFNLEGFFLNVGDMLVKSGDWQAGIVAYESAKLSASYERWPYRAMLEERVRSAEANVVAFRSDPPVPGKTIVFSSAYSCMVCHQAR